MELNCENNKHKPRDNRYGVTWCIKCGRLFTKPCGKPLDIEQWKGALKCTK